MENFTKKNYVPRHVRLQCGDNEVIEHPAAVHEVVESVPLLDDFGNVVLTQQVITEVLASEDLNKYKHEDFIMENLLAAGVPLSQVDFDRVSQRDYDYLHDLARDFDFALPSSLSPAPASVSSTPATPATPATPSTSN